MVGICMIIISYNVIIGHFLPGNFERRTYAILQSNQMNNGTISVVYIVACMTSDRI